MEHQIKWLQAKNLVLRHQLQERNKEIDFLKQKCPLSKSKEIT